LATFLMAGVPAMACPNCKDALASSGENGDDSQREAWAYNLSIYVMLAVPYTLLGTGCFIGYRMYRSANRPTPVPDQS